MIRDRARTGLAAAALAICLALAACGDSDTVAPPDVDPGAAGGPAPASVLALMEPAQRGAEYVGNDVCSTCHGGGDSRYDVPKMDFAAFRNSPHGQGRVNCEQCHGPGGNHANGPEKDNILGLPEMLTEQVCAGCHGTVAEQYAGSAHAHFVESPVEEARASCMACHSAPFNLEAVTSVLADGGTKQDVVAHIAALSQTEVTEMAEGTHATASCANCHDPHKATGNTSVAGDELMLHRGLTVTDPTAMPPVNTAWAEWLDFPQQCAACHMGGSSRTANPADSALRSGTARPNMHDNPQFYMLVGRGGVEQNATNDDNTTADFATHTTIPGQCAKCHMPNGNHGFRVDYGVSCAPCHSASQAAALTEHQHERVAQRLAALEARMSAWATTNAGGPLGWEYTSNGGTSNQAGLPIEILRTRHNYWLILRDLSGGVHNPRYADELLDVAEAQLDALGLPAAPAPSAARAQAVVEAARQRGAAASHEA